MFTFTRTGNKGNVSEMCVRGRDVRKKGRKRVHENVCRRNFEMCHMVVVNGYAMRVVRYSDPKQEESKSS